MLRLNSSFERLQPFSFRAHLRVYVACHKHLLRTIFVECLTCKTAIAALKFESAPVDERGVSAMLKLRDRRKCDEAKLIGSAEKATR